MIKHFIHFFLTLLYVCSSSVISAQHSDLIEHGLHGKVKSMTTIQYSLIQKSNNDWIFQDSSKMYGLFVRSFDKNGNIDSNYREYHYTSSADSISYSYGFTCQYSFNNLGRKESGILFKKWLNGMSFSGEEPALFYTYEWKNEREYTETERDSTSLNIYTIHKHELNENFIDLKCESKYYNENDSLYIHFKYTNTINKEGHIIQSIETDILNKETTVYTYVYKKLDQMGNPVIIYVYGDDKIQPNSIFYKRYEYYE